MHAPEEVMVEFGGGGLFEAGDARALRIEGAEDVIDRGRRAGRLSPRAQPMIDQSVVLRQVALVLGPRPAFVDNLIRVLSKTLTFFFDTTRLVEIRLIVCLAQVNLPSLPVACLTTPGPFQFRWRRSQ